MVERGRRARLPRKPLDGDSILGDAPRQHLDGNIAAEPPVVGAIDFAHAAGAARRDDCVRTELRAGRKSRFRFAPRRAERRRIDGDGRRVHEPLCVAGIRQQRFHFATKRVVVGARVTHELHALASSARKRVVIDPLDVLPAAGCV
jgi:hypothetical protein